MAVKKKSKWLKWLLVVLVLTGIGVGSVVSGLATQIVQFVPGRDPPGLTAVPVPVGAPVVGFLSTMLGKRYSPL